MCRLLGDKFVPPNATKIGGVLLDLNFKMTYERNKEEFLKEAGTFGLAFMGNGATIHRMPLMNVLAMSGTSSPVTVGIMDCTTHMAEGGNKDAAYISGIFDEKVMEYDPKMSLTDLFFFDGASNLQKAGQVLMAKFPRTFCFHGVEHVSLSSLQISQELIQSRYVIFYCPFLIIITTLTFLLCPQILILKTCRLYNIFRSGANHAIYAQFMAQSSMANKGRRVGLL